MKTLLTPLLLTLTTLFFVTNANAETFNTNIAGLVVKDVICVLGSYYSGRWVNRNNRSLGAKTIHINMYDSDWDSMGVQSTHVLNMGAETGSDFTMRPNLDSAHRAIELGLSSFANNALCKNARSFDISVTEP